MVWQCSGTMNASYALGLANEEGASVSMTSPTFGYIAIVVCAVCFGTNYLPVKKFTMGDGMFFQWMMCNAILLVGVIVNCAVGCPKFYPLAMFGGALWAVGNSLSVTIIEAIGVGLGIILWSMSNMLFGFATSRFGWFGIAQKIPKKPIMNYIGVAIALGSVIVFAAIKPNHPESKKEIPREGGEADNVVMTDRSTAKALLTDELKSTGKCGRICKPVSSMPLTQRRILGVVLAVLAGSFYGNTFVPTQYIQTWYQGASKEGLHYVFANFVGIWMTSTAIFFIYSLGKKNRPWIPHNNAIVPALTSGALWGTAQSAWFVANAALGEPVTFPIITTCPALIATICGMVFFKEITGKKNYILLAIAFCVTTTGHFNPRLPLLLSMHNSSPCSINLSNIDNHPPTISFPYLLMI
ncbi:transmembrane protein 144 [Echinococcus multilocularis]|uniref:Transmembrane protein 144 n=1 Tax=Echinococcus multilocularis TaxID=6211 RepID=A0A068YD56_ECHMU|nr:transmembrane protein 144 [Echinococcus multilocularis]